MDRSWRSGTGYRSSEVGSSRQFSVPKRGFHDCLRLRRRFAMATSDNRLSLLLLSQILIIMAFPEKPNLKIAPPLSLSLISSQKQLRFRRPRFSLFPVISIHYRKARPSSTRRPIHSLFACRLLRLFLPCPFAERGTNFPLSPSFLSSLNSELTFWPLLSLHNRVHSNAASRTAWYRFAHKGYCMFSICGD